MAGFLPSMRKRLRAGQVTYYGFSFLNGESCDGTCDLSSRAVEHPIAAGVPKLRLGFCSVGETAGSAPSHRLVVCPDGRNASCLGRMGRRVGMCRWIMDLVRRSGRKRRLQELGTPLTRLERQAPPFSGKGCTVRIRAWVVCALLFARVKVRRANEMGSVRVLGCSLGSWMVPSTRCTF